MPTNDIPMLNKTYGAPERIEFRPGPAGLPSVSLMAGNGTCDVALYGAHVLSYRPSDQEEVLWMSQSVATLKPGEAIRGGIPVCWPWFGAHPSDAQMPRHGFVRNRRWKLLATEYDARQTSVRLGLRHDAETLAIWPCQFRLELNIVLGDTLTLELATVNRGLDPFTITQALHTYLLVRQIADIRILGLENVAYLDTTPADKSVRQSGAVTIREETDRVYCGTDGTCTLVDPGYGRTVAIAKRGSRTTVVWNPWSAKARKITDMAATDYQKFVCIETSNAVDDAVTLEPGAEHVIAASLQVRSF